MNDYVNREGAYVYWNFEDNEVVQLTPGDGKVTHNPKEIKPGVDREADKLKDYKHMDAIGTAEIAFYRRKRTHDAIEKSGHQGKFAPDAIICEPTKENMQKIKETFGEMIPIICPDRGYLQRAKNDVKAVIEDFTESEKEKEDITEEKKEFLDQSYGAVGVTQGDLMTSGDLLKQTKEEEKRENFVSKVDSERQDIKNYEER